MIKGLLCCSFCGKSEKERAHLVAGVAVYICDVCVDLCRDVIAEQKARALKASPGATQP